MIDIITNKLYLKLLYVLIGISFATVISDLSFFNIFNKLVLLIGLAYTALNILEFITFRRRKIYSFEICLYLFLLLTLFLNFTQYKLNENLKIWLVNLMIMTVLFSIDMYKNKNQLLKELNIISYFYSILTFIISLISLVMIFMNKVITVDLGIKDDAPLILTYRGMFKNENSFGIAAVISIFIALYLLYSAKNKYIRGFLYSNILIQGISVFVAGGRSAYLPFLALIFLFLLYKFKNIYLRISFVVVPIIISIVSFFTLPDNILHKILTSREYIWQSALKLLKVCPLTGVGSVNKVGRLKDVRVAYLQGLDSGGLHNIFFEIATVNGIPATILFILFIILLFVFFIRKLDKLQPNLKLKYGFIFVLCLGIVFINFLESSLVYIISFISIIFWIYSGYLVAILEKESC